jgi:Zn-dependent oligopeptidase
VSSIGRTVAATQRAIEARMADVVAQRGLRTFANTLVPLDEIWRLAIDAGGVSGFFAQVHPAERVREAAAQAEGRLDGMRGQLFGSRPLHEAVRAYAETAEAQVLSPAQRLFLERTLADFARSGADLSPTAHRRLEKLNHRLGRLGEQFLSNLARLDGGRDLEAAELVGLSESLLARLRPGRRAGSRHLSSDETEILAFLAASPRRDLREEMETRLINLAHRENRPLLLEALALRREMAGLFGYRSWAEYNLVPRLAGTPANVFAFLERLTTPLQRLGALELAAAAAYLDPPGGPADLRSWDWLYGLARYRAAHDDPAADELAAYFPLDSVFASLLELAGEVFGLIFHPVPDPPVWHPQVRLYEVRDRADGRSLALLYTDLLARPGKWDQPFAAPLVAGEFGPDGTVRRRPVGVLVASLAAPSPEAPTLLEYAELIGLFHEFGHALHLCLMNRELARFNVFDGEWEGEFVEAPSQILEHWASEPAVLARFAVHYRSGAALAPTRLAGLAASRSYGAAINTLRQIYLARLDLELHGPTESRDLEALDRAACAVGLLPYHEGTCRPTSFGHLFGGYDAGYYGYLWSKVYGDDMYSRFAAAGITDPVVGAAYRREILEPGWSRPVSHGLRAFLGRQAKDDAFLAGLGLTEAMATARVETTLGPSRPDQERSSAKRDRQ